MTLRTIPLALLALACSSPATAPPANQPTATLDITTDRVEYRGGERGTVRITNKAVDAVVLFNVCERALDWWDGGAWQEAQPAPTGCLPVLGLLRPGQGAQGEFVVDPALSAGHYRLRFVALADSATGLLAEAERVSSSFAVRR